MPDNPNERENQDRSRVIPNELPFKKDNREAQKDQVDDRDRELYKENRPEENKRRAG